MDQKDRQEREACEREVAYLVNDIKMLLHDLKQPLDAVTKELAEVKTRREETVAMCTYLEHELAQVRQAIGLMTTLKGDMEVDVNDPIGMMQQVHAHVTQQLTEAQQREARLFNACNLALSIFVNQEDIDKFPVLYAELREAVRETQP